MRMNAGRKDNYREVVMEHKRAVDPAAEARERAAQRRAERQREEHAAEGPGVRGGEQAEEEGGSSGIAPKRARPVGEEEEEEGATRGGGKPPQKRSELPRYMQETVGSAEAAAVKRELQREKLATGQLYGAEADFKQYEKSLALPPSAPSGGGGGSGLCATAPLGAPALLLPAAAAAAGGSFAYGALAGSGDSGAARLVGAMQDAQRRSAAAASRYRTVDEGVGGGAYINEPNRAYLAQLGKHTDKFTLEIRQNLERGTAL